MKRRSSSRLYAAFGALTIFAVLGFIAIAAVFMAISLANPDLTERRIYMNHPELFWGAACCFVLAIPGIIYFNRDW